MSDPLVLIVDKNDKPIGSATKQESWEKGLVHRIVRFMVEDRQGNILLQKRSDKLPLYPGRWDNSAAGHVDDGEDYLTAAKRELKEEIGLDVKTLEEIGNYYNEATHEWRKLNRFNRIYRLVIDPKQKIDFNPGEVSEVKWFSVNEAKKLIKEHPELVTDGLRDVITKFY